jgi:hypothetical protein
MADTPTATDKRPNLIDVIGEGDDAFVLSAEKSPAEVRAFAAGVEFGVRHMNESLAAHIRRYADYVSVQQELLAGDLMATLKVAVERESKTPE